MWQLAAPDWSPPNLTLLNNALAQTGWHGDKLTNDNWRAVVSSTLADCDWQRATADVGPFLQVGSDVTWLTRDHLLRLLEQSTGYRSHFEHVVDQPRNGTRDFAGHRSQENRTGQ